MKLYCNRSNLGFVAGRFGFFLWWNPRVWSVSLHRGPCCWLAVEFGPLDLGIAR